MNRPLDSQLEPLARKYARELGEVSPSKDLDARIDRLVAAHRDESFTGRRVERSGPRTRPAPIVVPRWVAAAALAVVAIAAGVLIGVSLGRGGSGPATALDASKSAGASANANANADANAIADAAAWPLPEMSMWPTDSVALKIPAVYAADGTLVAVDDPARQTSARYWVDVVVSNDGTVRIQNVVPAGVTPSGNQEHAQKLQSQ